ncbi:MAG: thioester reductase domain-containing protein [Chromatiaceae bacterium]|nr:thioester reductase domain-containing protein [Chromatiaceae bacterium]
MSKMSNIEYDIPPDAIEDFLISRFSEALQVSRSDISVGSRFTELGVDSMTAVRMLGSLESRFGKRITPDAFVLFPSIDRLAKNLGRVDWLDVLEEALPVAESLKQCEAESKRNAAALHPLPVEQPDWKIKTVFLTGATGVLGAYLLKDLLQTTDCKIDCLVRAASPSGGKRRLHALLRVYDSEGDLDAAFDERVAAVPGDLAKPELGLSDRQRDSLADSVDVVIHNAAVTSLISPYSELATPNVDGTDRVVEMALRTRNQYLVHVSSYSIFGDALAMGNHLSEADFDVGQTFSFMGGYPRSKFHAEKIVRAYGKDGLRWKIARPGDIMGESKQGRYPLDLPGVTTLYYELLRTVIETGVVPDAPDFCFRPIPVDCVSAGIIHLTMRHSFLYETFHLFPTQVVRLGALTELLIEYGFDIRKLPVTEYRDRIAELRYESLPLMLLMWGLSSTRPKGAVRLDSERSRSILESAGIRCPEFDASLLSRYVDYCVDSGFLEPPA